MQQMSPVEFFDNEILPKINLELVYSALNPIDKGSRYEADCPNPSCGKKGKAYIYKNTRLLICNICNHRTDVIAYKNGGSHPSDSAWHDLVKELADHVGVTIPEKKWSAEDKAKYAKKVQFQSICEAFRTITTEALSSVEYPESRYLSLAIGRTRNLQNSTSVIAH